MSDQNPKPKKATPPKVVLVPGKESPLNMLVKNFIVGGLNTVVNTHVKGLTVEFQNKAVQMAETILKKGTADEIAQLNNLYLKCKER